MKASTPRLINVKRNILAKCLANLKIQPESARNSSVKTNDNKPMTQKLYDLMQPFINPQKNSFELIANYTLNSRLSGRKEFNTLPSRIKGDRRCSVRCQTNPLGRLLSTSVEKQRNPKLPVIPRAICSNKRNRSK